MEAIVHSASNLAHAGLPAHTPIPDPDRRTAKCRLAFEQALYVALGKTAAVTNYMPPSSSSCGGERSDCTPNMKEPRSTEVEAGSSERRRSRQMWKASIGRQPSRVGNDAQRVRKAPCWPASPWQRARVSQTISPPGI